MTQQTTLHPVHHPVDYPVGHPVDHFNKTVKKSFREIFKKFLQEEQLKGILRRNPTRDSLGNFLQKSYKELLKVNLSEILAKNP